MSAPTSLVDQLKSWAASQPDSPAIYGRSETGWNTWSWKAYWEDAQSVGRGLIALGHEVGDCVAIVGDNRPEWVLSELGIMAARGVPAPIYTTLMREQVAFIVDHAQAKIAICDKAEQLAKYLEAIELGEITTVERIITMDDLGSSDERVMTFDELLELGHSQEKGPLEERIDSIQEDETALLIYTSGTTGTPKAVQLEHGGLLHVSRVCVDRAGPLRQHYRSVSYLPLCHVAEQLFTTLFHLETGGEVYFCPDLKQIKDFLVEARPTFFAGVPRVWEKFQGALETRLGEATGVKAALARWARATELAAFKKEVETGEPQNGIRRKLANKLVISKVKAALGLDQVIMAGTGAAPIGVSTLEFFASLGITIYEGYGMSETSGLATTGVIGKPRFGTVGTALEGVTIKIADDDEILLKGRNMTRGYLRQEAQTKDLIDEDGW
ncbi:MAG: AMP-binding protein, partial [Myxococcota bacterium]